MQRATSVFVQLADQFQAEIRVSKGDLTVSGKSIMGLMMLAAALGQDIDIETFGADDAKAALDALVALVTINLTKKIKPSFHAEKAPSYHRLTV